MKTFLTNTLQRKAEKHTSWLLLLSDLDIDTGSDVKEFTDEIWQSLNIPPLLKSSLEKNFRTSKHPLETVETPATPAPTAPSSKHPAIPDQSQVHQENNLQTWNKILQEDLKMYNTRNSKEESAVVVQKADTLHISCYYCPDMKNPPGLRAKYKYRCTNFITGHLGSLKHKTNYTATSPINPYDATSTRKVTMKHTHSSMFNEMTTRVAQPDLKDCFRVFPGTEDKPPGLQCVTCDSRIYYPKAGGWTQNAKSHIDSKACSTVVKKKTLIKQENFTTTRKRPRDEMSKLTSIKTDRSELDPKGAPPRLSLCS